MTAQNLPARMHCALFRECLVPFPPLTYMLKFSGFACLTSCYERSARSTVARPQASATSPTHIPENGCSETTKHVHACTKATPVTRRWQTRQQHATSCHDNPRQSHARTQCATSFSSPPRVRASTQYLLLLCYIHGTIEGLHIPIQFLDILIWRLRRSVKRVLSTCSMVYQGRFLSWSLQPRILNIPEQFNHGYWSDTRSDVGTSKLVWDQKG